MGFDRAGEAYFSPDGQMISFQAVLNGENDFQIFTMDLNTKEIRKISRGAKACTCSFFRPDGKKIIFAASPQTGSPASGGKYHWDFTPYMNIYEANVDGTEAVALTYGPAYHAECAYSSDGSLIVYASNEDGSMNIYVMNSDGTDPKQITHTNHCYNGGPFFSPDDSKIIFRADRDTPDLLQIYMMDVNGENLVQLTDNSAVNWAPFWHPSGNAIAYTTSIHGHRNYEIYLLFLESGEHYRVTHHSGFDGLPTFNFDGTKILWTSKRGECGASQVFIANFAIPENWLRNTN
jgi:Tol biopolymer transport system component